MIAQAQASERVLMVGQVLQFWPEYVIARNIIRQGELGQVKVGHSLAGIWDVELGMAAAVASSHLWAGWP